MDENIINITQSLKDLAMKEAEQLDEFIAENNDDINLDTEYPYLIFKRDELIRVMNLSNKIVQQKSDIASYNSISLIPDINNKSIYFYATNELSHFKYCSELFTYSCIWLCCSRVYDLGELYCLCAIKLYCDEIDAEKKKFAR